MNRNRSAESLALLLAFVFLALHLPYLPSSLEDLDSINFALGIRHFDVAQHQPHPPGYPVYILIAKAVHAVVRSEARALGALSAVAGALGVLAIAALFGRFDRDESSNGWTLAAVGVAMTSPLYWFTAIRPLSDMTGLAAALAVQAMTLAAGTRRELAIAALLAGLATGLRSQAAWLTVPLLILKGLGAGGWGLRREPAPGAPSPQHLAAVAAAFAAGVAAWVLPLFAITGGPAAYWRALSNQGAEDLGNISMLWTTHTVRAVTDALYYAFIAPWAAWPVAVVMLVAAAAGIVWAARRNRAALAALAAAFVPYVVFDLLFQETFTSRYALPLVVPIAYLAVQGLRWIPRQNGVVVVIAIAMFDAHTAGTSIAAYSRQRAPAFRLLDDMASAARTASAPPVLAMDRRNAFDFRRPIVWTGGAMPPIGQQLPSPPQHEWLEPVKYWNDGGRAPVWFVVDPKRAGIDLVQHGDPLRYRWPLAYPALLSGARPDEMDWYRVDRPEWYVGEGWSLTPESAGVAEADKRDLANAPIAAWLNRATLGGTLMIGGRSFDTTARPMLSVVVDERSVLDEALRPGAFVFFANLPPDRSGMTDRNGYAPLVVRSTAGVRVGIEQFEASATRPLLAFGDGWHEQELNPRTGLRWRWLSDRGELKVRAPAGPVSLHIEGESPRTYFSRGSHLMIRAGTATVFDRVLDDNFSLDVPIENAGDTIVLETDQAYVPAERSRRTQDRRRLGLRIFRCEIRRP